MQGLNLPLIQRVLFESERAWGDERRASEVLTSWREAVKHYRELLFASLRRSTAREGEDPASMTDVESLTRQVRYFIDGLVIGSRSFVDCVYRLTRDQFGSKRRDGARKIRGMTTILTSMRDLKTGLPS